MCVCVLQLLQRIQIKPKLNIVKWVITIRCEIKINSGRTMYYCEKKLRQQKSMKRRFGNEVDEDSDSLPHDARRY